MSFDKIISKDSRPQPRLFRNNPQPVSFSNETQAFMNRSEASSSKILGTRDSRIPLQPLPGRALHPKLADAESFSKTQQYLPKISGLEPRQLRLVVENFRREQNQRLLSSLTIEDGSEGIRAKAEALAGSGAEIRRLKALHAVQRIESRNTVLRKTVELEAELVNYLKELGIRAPARFLDDTDNR